jgi:hypothetical protein
MMFIDQHCLVDFCADRDATVFVDSDRCVSMRLVVEVSDTLRKAVFGDALLFTQKSDSSKRISGNTASVAVVAGANADSEREISGVMQQGEGLLLARTRPPRRNPRK